MSVYSVHKPGLLESAVNKLLARELEVRRVDEPVEGFRLVTFGATSLRDQSWTPGDMMQLSFGGWEHRAYTPIAYDAQRGELTFLAVIHGLGIASQWLATLKGGERCQVGKLRHALNLPALQRPLVMFGDETSIGTAAAMGPRVQGRLVFEASSVEQTQAMLAHLGLTATVVQREDFEGVDRAVLAACRGASDVVLTGKSTSIQRLYRAVRKLEPRPRKILNMAYWATGKRGLSGVQK